MHSKKSKRYDLYQGRIQGGGHRGQVGKVARSTCEAEKTAKSIREAEINHAKNEISWKKMLQSKINQSGHTRWIYEGIF